MGKMSRLSGKPPTKPVDATTTIHIYAAPNSTRCAPSAPRSSWSATCRSWVRSRAPPGAPAGSPLTRSDNGRTKPTRGAATLMHGVGIRSSCTIGAERPLFGRSRSPASTSLPRPPESGDHQDFDQHNVRANSTFFAALEMRHDSTKSCPRQCH